MVGILAANSAVSAGYSIDDSLRFNDNDSAYLTRTNSGGNRKTWTWSSWVKRCDIPSSGSQQFIFTSNNTTNYSSMFFDESTNRFNFYNYSGGYVDRLETNAVYRDVSAWYHFFIKHDSTQSTEADRLELYVNGVKVTSFATANYPTLNYDSYMNVSGYNNIIGRQQVGDSALFDGYIAETYLIDGTAKAPTDFGEFDEDSGIWKPIRYSGSYGTNGFKLDFSDSGSLGADSSGNGNNFTATNLASTDQTTDTPINNFATLNPLTSGAEAEFSQGNLRFAANTSQTYPFASSTIGFSSGKWYCEFLREANAVTGGVGIYGTDLTGNGDPTTRYTYERTGSKYNNASYTSYGASWGVGDVIGIAYDGSTGNVVYYKNGVSQGTAYTIPTSAVYVFGCQSYTSGTQVDVANFGQDSSFAGNKTAQGNTDDNEFGDFYYAPPSGYLALCSQNLATELSPTIDDGSQYFNTLTWSGDSANRNITGVGFQPDFVWIKCRSDSAGHVLFDSSRGASKRLVSNAQAGETTTNEYGFVTAFGSDGFTLTGGNQGGYAHGDTNLSGRTYVGWNWKLNGGITSSNTDGTITSTVQANQTAGASIVTWTGNNTSGATVGHGLGKQVDMVITKRVDGVSDWNTWHNGLTGSQYLTLNKTNAAANDAGSFPDATGMNSTVFKIGNGSWINGSSSSLIAFCFASIEGYSKIGSYTGNGNADGTFVYTGFRPAFVYAKWVTGANHHVLYDNAINAHNPASTYQRTNDTATDGLNTPIDFLSNGFKMRSTDSAINSNGGSYIFMAFAENPFVDSNGVPVTAR